MKITKRQLRRIIKEEISRLVESSQSGGGGGDRSRRLDPTAHQWSSRDRKKSASKLGRQLAQQEIDHNSLSPAELDEYEAGYDDGLEELPSQGDSELYSAGYEDGTHDRPATLRDNPRMAALDRSGSRRPR